MLASDPKQRVQTSISTHNHIVANIYQALFFVELRAPQTRNYKN